MAIVDPVLLAASICFAASLGITESMSPHKFSEQMISHSFQYSVPQVAGFLLAAAGLIHTGLPVAIVTGAALVAVPLTDLVRRPFGRWRKRIHVISAGAAFCGVFVMGVMHSASPMQVVVLVAYPSAVLLSWLIWRNDVVAEKVAAYACIAWLITYSAGM